MRFPGFTAWKLAVLCISTLCLGAQTANYVGHSITLSTFVLSGVITICALVLMVLPSKSNLPAARQIGKVVLADYLREITEHWRPCVVGELNGQEVKLVKFRGEFVWHHHEHADEMFLPVKGTMRVELREKTVDLGPGEFLIIPHGVEHRTGAAEEVECLLVEPAGTRNTGNVEHPILTAPVGRAS